MNPSRPQFFPRILRRVLWRITQRVLPAKFLNKVAFGGALGFSRSETVLDRVGDLAVEYSMTSVVGELLFFRGGFEAEEWRYISQRLETCDGGIMIDIGANIGMHSLLAGKLPKVEKIFAFEPAQATLALLERNIARNNLSEKVQASPLAMGATEGTAQFYYCADNAYSSLSPDDRSPVLQTYDVQVTTLDRWVKTQGIRRISLVKIDVEGGEPGVIAGARETLRELKPELIVEIYQGSRKNYDAESFVGEICALGYDAFVLVNGVPVPFEHHSDAYFNYHFRPIGKP